MRRGVPKTFLLPVITKSYRFLLISWAALSKTRPTAILYYAKSIQKWRDTAPVRKWSQKETREGEISEAANQGNRLEKYCGNKESD